MAKKTKPPLLQAHELLANLPQLLPLHPVADLIADVIHERALVVVPAPVVAGRLPELRVGHHLRQPLAGRVLGHVPLGHVLLEEREELLEDPVVLAEQTRLGDAPGVEGRERDAGLLMVSPVELADCEHVAHLRVLVRLGAVKLAAVDHDGGRLFAEARGEPAEIAQVGLGGDVTCGKKDRVRGCQGTLPVFKKTGLGAVQGATYSKKKGRSSEKCRFCDFPVFAFAERFPHVCTCRYVSCAGVKARGLQY
jgi:hypothetical protein